MPCSWDGAAHAWYNDRSQTTVMEYNKPKHNDVHPTMKVVEMLVYLIKNSSKRGEIVISSVEISLLNVRGHEMLVHEKTVVSCQQFKTHRI